MMFYVEIALEEGSPVPPLLSYENFTLFAPSLILLDPWLNGLITSCLTFDFFHGIFWLYKLHPFLEVPQCGI